MHINHGLLDSEATTPPRETSAPLSLSLWGKVQSCGGFLLLPFCVGMFWGTFDGTVLDADIYLKMVYNLFLLLFSPLFMFVSLPLTRERVTTNIPLLGRNFRFFLGTGTLAGKTVLGVPCVRMIFLFLLICRFWWVDKLHCTDWSPSPREP